MPQLLDIPPAIRRIIYQVIEIEVGGASDPGGYSNDPDDPGGPTRWGVTQAVARAHGYDGRMRDYPHAAAFDVFLDEYAVKPGFLKVAQRSNTLARELIEAGVNLGPTRPSRWLQDSLNLFNNRGQRYGDIAADGDIGRQTLTVGLDGFMASRPGHDAIRVLARNLNILQGSEYNRLATTHAAFERFVYGWIAQRTSVVEIPGKLHGAHLAQAA